MLSPNPCHDNIYLNFVNKGKHVQVSILNALGARLDIPVNKTLDQIAHEIEINTSQYVAGSYFVRLAVDNKVKTMKFVKI